MNSLPPPIRTGLQAIYALRWAKKTKRCYDDSYQTGLMGSDRSISVSARALLDLAAGRIDHDRFVEIVGIVGVEQLNRLLNRGLSVKSIAIENAAKGRSGTVSDDADFAVITFGEPDPAVLPFGIPGSSSIRERE